MTEFTRPGTLDTVRDPDLDGLDDLEEASDLDDVRAELNAEVAVTTRLLVEGRPGYAVDYRVDFTGRDVDNLRKRSKDRKFSDGIDGVKFGALLLAFTCVGIQRHGKPLDLGTGKPVTFTSPELQELLGTHDAHSTVRRLYGLDGHVDATARRLMTEAGWGDEATEADPTE